MPLLRYDTSPTIIRFNDSMPVTEGAQNLLAALIRAPALRAEGEDRRARWAQEDARSQERMDLARSADGRAQERHELEMQRLRDPAAKKAPDLVKMGREFDHYWPDAEPPKQDEYKDRDGMPDTLAYQRAKRDYLYQQKARSDAKRKYMTDGELMGPDEFMKQNRPQPKPGAGAKTLQPFADSLAQGMQEARDNPAAMFTNLMNKLGFGGGGSEAETTTEAAPAVEEPAPAAPPRSEPSARVQHERELMTIAEKQPHQLTTEDIVKLQESLRNPPEPLSDMDRLGLASDHAKSVGRRMERGKAMEQAPRRVAELTGHEYDTATPEFKKFYDELGPLLVQASEDNPQALKRLNELKNGEYGSWVKMVIARWGAKRS